MKYNKQALYLSMERFYLATTTDGGDDLQSIRTRMGGLVRKARKVISPDEDVKMQIHKLLQLMYGDWGFSCPNDHYFHLEHLYLSYVLRAKQGMPVSLGCILLYLADKLNLPLYPTKFPLQLVLRADVDGEVAFINPLNGEYMQRDDLQKLYEGTMGFGVPLTADELDIAEQKYLEDRFDHLAKGCLLQAEQNEMALRFIEYRMATLQLQDDPYERRDRGLVLAKMGAYHVAIQDLEYFVEKCPMDPSALLLMAELPKMKKELNETLH